MTSYKIKNLWINEISIRLNDHDKIPMYITSELWTLNKDWQSSHMAISKQI